MARNMTSEPKNMDPRVKVKQK